MSGINLDLLKESGKDPFGVCQTGVGSNAISVTDACARYTRNTVAFRTPCSMILISGAPVSLEQHSLLFGGQ